MVFIVARKTSADKIKDLQLKMKKLEEQIKEEAKKRDEELGKIFREEWGIEDSDTARLVINSLKSDVEKLINGVPMDPQPQTLETKDESKIDETKVSQSIS
jgi:hypothetical protein